VPEVLLDADRAARIGRSGTAPPVVWRDLMFEGPLDADRLPPCPRVV